MKLERQGFFTLPSQNSFRKSLFPELPFPDRDARHAETQKEQNARFGNRRRITLRIRIVGKRGLGVFTEKVEVNGDLIAQLVTSTAKAA